MFLPGEVGHLRVELQLGDVVSRVVAGLPPAVRQVPPSGAQYGGARLVAVLHHPAAPKCFRNTGGAAGGSAGGDGGAGGGAHICTQIVLRLS